MRRFSWIAAVLFVVMLPFSAMAQQRTPAPQPQPQQQGIDGISTGKLIAIGGGAVIGAVLLESVVVGDAAALAGGVIGGFVGAWWYDSRGEMSQRASLRQSASYDVALRQPSLGHSF